MSKTIQGIAEHLGISKSTVSRALNNHADVNKETKERVLIAANEMNYHPNTIAQNLRKQKSGIIGVIVPELVNQFFSKAIKGIREVAEREGYHLLLSHSDENMEREIKSINTFEKARVEGILVSVSNETNNFDHFDNIKLNDVPVVFFDRVCPGLEHDIVVGDNFDISFKATQHMIDQGISRILYIHGPLKLLNFKRRYEGHLECIKRNNLNFNRKLFVEANDLTWFDHQILIKVLKGPERPEGIMIYNDYAAMKMLSLLKSLDIKVPDDILLMGFNNEPFAQYADPPITSVNHPSEEMGSVAAEYLISKIKGLEIEDSSKMVKSELIIRDSTQKP